MRLSVSSEIGKLKGVIIHTPGYEVENMTPRNAERALYSDILNLHVAQKEYEEFKGILNLFADIFEIKTLLQDVLSNTAAKEKLIKRICSHENRPELFDYLHELAPDELSVQLIEGVPLVRDNLTKFMSDEYYSLKPLHNFFFTRDSAVTIGDKILITRMKNKIRKRESFILQTIMMYHPSFSGEIIVPDESDFFNEKVTLEGGDIHIVRDNIIIAGIGSRTSTQGVDFLLEYIKKNKINMHIIAQELPLEPESFIHLDMVFTILDKDKCMVYPPVVNNIHNFQTVHIEVDNGKVKSISERKDIPCALRKLGLDLQPIVCGGMEDEWNQEREQWHSGANFLALAPGKIIGYERNQHTIGELDKNGFNILSAKDILKGKVSADDYEKCVITIEGSELARGGGGCRCMSMPISREKVKW